MISAARCWQVRQLTHAQLERPRKPYELWNLVVRLANENLGWGYTKIRDGFLRDAKYVVHDHDPLFTKKWKLILSSSGIESVAIPAQSPNCSPPANGSSSALGMSASDDFIVFGEAQLRHLVCEYVTHYNAERYHQSLGGKLLLYDVSAANDNHATEVVKSRSRLSGDFYHRAAA